MCNAAAQQPPPVLRRWTVAEVQIHKNGNVFSRLRYFRARDSCHPDGMHTIGGVMKDSIKSLTSWPGRGRMSDELIQYDKDVNKVDVLRKRKWQASELRVRTIKVGMHRCLVICINILDITAMTAPI